MWSRLSVAEIAELLAAADVVGCSTYVWNIELTLAVVRELKRRRPEILVVLGGPQVPDHAESFLRANPEVDLVCHGEGEAVFTAVLTRADDRRWDGIPGVSYLADGGRFVTQPQAERTRDLDTLPSPYLSGIFEPVLAAFPEQRWVATWETNRGCPFACTFCDWGSAVATRVYRFGMARLEEEIVWFSRHRIGFVLCCDANFGMLARDLDIARKVVSARATTGYPFSLSVQNTKNSTERSYEIQKLLHGHMYTIGVTLSLQSANSDTLRNIERANIRSSSFTELQQRFVRDGVYTYTDLIIGLPGESYVAFADSVSQVIADGQHNHIQFHNCVVLPNARMADPEYRSRFGMMTVHQPVRAVHTPADEAPEVEEFLDTVVATSAMPAEEWVRAKTFAWMTDLVYFDRLLQIPFLLLGQRHGVPFRRILESLTEADARRFPVLGWVHAVLRDHARRIQQGGIEYLTAGPGQRLRWPADQYLYVQMVLDGRLDDFYREAHDALATVLAEVQGGLPAGEATDSFDLFEEATLVEEACMLNRALLRLPGQQRDTHLVLSHDVWAFWQAAHRGNRHPLPEQMAVYRVRHAEHHWDGVADWAEYLVWCQGRDKRAYLAEAVPARGVAWVP
ncbi:cobalamin-dependent protein [Frankia sp. AgB32]|nr:cobalamin-dependent protein [Frankia sp. AgB32]